jgi:hypothetical protein
MKNMLIIFCLLPSSLINTMQIEEKNLHIPGRLSGISVYKTDKGFEVVEADYTRVAIPSHQVNTDLRRMNMHQLATFTKTGYFIVNQSDDRQYSLDVRQRLKGGGIWGAYLGASAGIFIVNFTAQAAILGTGAVISTFATPAVGGAFIIAAEKTLAPSIAIASHTVAVGLGIAGGVATGLV